MEISLSTEPDYISLETTEGFVSYLAIKDSIFDFFPYMEFVMNSESDIFTERQIFIEGLKFKMKFKDDYENKLNHDFFWSKQTISNPTSGNTISGMIMNQLLSYYKFKDSVKSNSYLLDISNIVRSIAIKYLKDLKVSNTNNLDNWYQSNMEDFQFIKLLSKYSQSLLFNKSPFLTFINLNNEFYFKTLSELFMSKEESVLTFGQDKNPNLALLNNSNILNYSIEYMGVPDNIQNYSKQIYGIDSNGIYKKQKRSMKDLKKIGKHLNLKSNNSSLKSVNNYGIIDRNNNFIGYSNNLLYDSCFSYRMSVQLSNSNLKLVSGKSVKTSFLGTEKGSSESRLFSDKWIILSSSHVFTDKNSSTQLLLGRNNIPNVYKNSITKDIN